MNVVVPDGAVAGQVLTVQAPSGQRIQASIPPGVAPGQSFQCRFQAAAPAQPGAVALQVAPAGPAKAVVAL